MEPQRFEYFFFIFFLELLQNLHIFEKEGQNKANWTREGRAIQLEMSEPKHGQAAELPRMVDTAAFASPMQVRLLI
jgi:hypothetical protein